MTFADALKKQVLILDGAMGTMVQNLNLTDAAFGGAEFKMLTDLLIFSRLVSEAIVSPAFLHHVAREG